MALDPDLDADAGEVEAICLARESSAAAIWIDDRKGRIAAQRLGLAVTGTLGLLELAAARGLIELPTVIAKLDQTNARLDTELVQAALERDFMRRAQERPSNLKPRFDPEP